MKISTLRLKNFRQFQGESEIRFSDSENQPFTIFYGTNGGGKTTLLAALFYVIQGGDFRFVDSSKHDLNSTHFESGADDSELSLSVEIDFEEGGKSYTAKRERTFRKRGDEELFVRELFEIQNENGELIHPAQRWMNTLMPPNLIKFFFFPGEALDTFYNDENVRKLRQDIHTITKLDVLQRGAEIAKTSSAEIAKHLQNATVEVELRSALDAQGAAKTAVDFGETEEKRLSDEIQKAKNQIAQFEKTLQSNAIARNAISERKLGETKVANANIRIGEIEQKIRELRANRFYSLFSDHLSERVIQVLDLMESTGQIGSKWTPNQLESLLKHESHCVCGREIGPDEKAKFQTEIERFLSSFSATPYLELKDAVSSGALGSRALIAALEDARAQLLTHEEERESGVVQIESTRDIVDGDLELGILDALSGFEEYSDARDELETELREVKARLALAKQQLTECDARIKVLSSTVESSKSPILQMQYLDRLNIELLQEVEEKDFALRAELLSELKMMLPRLYDVEIDVEIDDDFMPVVKMKSGNLGQAQGQKQGHALIMMIALNRIANRHAGELREFNIQGSSSFPLVIDSAFGQLDGRFRGLIAEELSREPGQIVILVSSQQAKGVVDVIGIEKCREEYLLQIQVPGQGMTEHFEIDGGRRLEGKIFGADTWQTQIIGVAK